MYYLYLKLFNNIKSEHESKELAKLELEGLFGRVTPIHNFFDELKEQPLSIFTSPDIRIQDFISHELPYGKVQGYFSTSHSFPDLKKLVKRLAYTREIYLIGTKEDIPTIKNIFPNRSYGRIYHFFEKGNLVCFRFITYQYFLEKSEYISKLSRNEKEVDRNVGILFSHLTKNLYRIPASSTLNIGKRLEDYFAIREEPSLYLTHYFHPYKGKFHPKMARALLNYICPQENKIVMDNFVGSGTLLVEASFMELDSIGVEINPLSVLMSNVKCHSLLIDTIFLKAGIEKYFNKVREALTIYHDRRKGQLSFVHDLNIDFKEIKEETKRLSVKLKDNYLRDKEEIIPQVLICRKLLSTIEDVQIREFLLLALSGTISDVARRTKEEFQEVFERRIDDLYLRLYLFRKLNEILDIKIGKSITYEGDARNMSTIKDESIDGIVNSPPYAVALDYIKNDYPQLVLLELTQSIEELERKMIGNPRGNHDRRTLISEVEETSGSLPESANKIINCLVQNGRQQAGLWSYNFFIDMHRALQEMYRVMKKGSKCAIIIGNNHFKVGNNYVEVPNDRVVLEIAVKIGFTVDKFIRRELHKSSEGNIREESIVILKKDA